MTNSELEKLIRELIDESLDKSSQKSSQKKLLVVEVNEGDYNKYTDAVKKALNSEYNVMITNCSGAMQSENTIPLLITALPFDVQAKAALGIADCPLSRLLQYCFIKGRTIIILKSSLEPLSDISSFNYRKLFSAYQRKLFEYGLKIIEINQLVRETHKSPVLLAANLINMAEGSRVDIDRDCIISYAANEIIRDKKLNIKRR